jgi:glutamine synthetase
MVAINTIIADSLEFIATKLEGLVAAGTDFNAAVQQVLQEIIADHGAVVFNGDGYSEDWQLEAAARGLKNLRTSVDALPELDTPEVRDLMGRFGVLNERELHSRYEVYLEQYHLAVQVEARSVLEIARTMVLPAAVRYQGQLAAAAASLRAIDYPVDTSLLDAVTGPIGELMTAIAALDEALAHDGETDTLGEATHAGQVLIPAMTAVRAAADALEALVADDLWPLPTYQEMLGTL